jgi:hypothetical protein
MGIRVKVAAELAWTEFRNRIVELRRIKASELRRHPRNWRVFRMAGFLGNDDLIGHWIDSTATRRNI